jgi:NAD(P)H dehydrogenase (quinone)
MSRHALVVVANPSLDSFSHAMAHAAGETLRAHAYQVVSHDLYAERFDPVQSTGEAANRASPDELVEQHCRDLSDAKLILVFHPNWWGQPPAILKGWIDRVFRPGVAYDYLPGVGYEGEPIGLLKATSALIFNTSNTPRDREMSEFGDPLENLWKRCVFGLCGVPNFERRVFGPIAASTREQRQGWLREVEDVVARHA